MSAILSRRSPRPWLAVAITAVLLVLALLAAWQMSQSRAGRDRLGPPEAAGDWPVTWQPPQQWGELPERWRGATVVAGRLDRDGRAVLLLFRDMGRFLPPKVVTPQMLRPVLDRRFRRYRLVREAREPSSLGPLAASESLWTVTGSQEAAILLVRQAVDPTGRALAVVWASRYAPREKDLRLLDALADSLQVTDLVFHPSGQETAGTGALHVELPTGARLVQAKGRMLVACPHHAMRPWNVELWPAGLELGRTLDDLLRERLGAASLGRSDIQWGQRENVAGREMIWAVVGRRSQGDLLQVVAAVALDQSRAVVIEAVGELDGVNELVALCRHLGATVAFAGDPA